MSIENSNSGNFKREPYKIHHKENGVWKPLETAFDSLPRNQQDASTLALEKTTTGTGPDQPVAPFPIHWEKGSERVQNISSRGADGRTA